MFALILWEKTQESDVVSIEHVRKSKGKIVAKWGAAWFPVKLIKRSENKDWLESLDVTVDGEIITPERRSSIPEDLITERRKNQQEKKAAESLKKGVIAEFNDDLIKSRSVFEKGGGSDQADTEESDIEQKKMDKSDDEKSDDSAESFVSSKHNKKIDKPGQKKQSFVKTDPRPSYRVNNAVASPPLKRRVTATADTSNHGENTIESHDENSRVCVCENLPIVSEEDLQTLSKVLELARHINVIQNDPQEVTLKKISGCQNRGVITSHPAGIQMNSEMELMKGTGIIVNAWKVQQIKNAYNKNPKEMVRKLMKLIIGEEKLKNMSPTGKNDRDPIPENIYEAVEQFVNCNVSKSKYQINHKVYRETLTAMCATLRNPKPKAGDLKNIQKGKPNQVKNKEFDEQQPSTSKKQNDLQQHVKEVPATNSENESKELNELGELDELNELGELDELNELGELDELIELDETEELEKSERENDQHKSNVEKTTKKTTRTNKNTKKETQEKSSTDKDNKKETQERSSSDKDKKNETQEKNSKKRPADTLKPLRKKKRN